MSEASTAKGGQELAIIRQSVGLQKRGHDVLLLLHPGASIEHLAARWGLRSTSLPMRRLTLAGLRGFRKVLRFERPDILHVNSSRDSWLGAVAARLVYPRIKVIKSRHISAPLNRNLPTRLLYRRLFDYVIGTGGQTLYRDLVERDGLAPDRVEAFPIGIDLGRHTPGGPEHDLRVELGLPSNHRLIGIVSYLRSYKGHRYLIEAAAQLVPRIKDVTFLIVGEGPDEDAIKRQIADARLENHVRMLGFRPDLLNVLRSLDIFVIPSVEGDTIPQVLIEAMAVGLPVISTSAGSIPDVIMDRQTGMIVAPRDSATLARRIEELLGDAALRHTLGSNAHRLVAEHYSIDRMLDRVEQIYRKVLSQN
ncbi:MAG TPA: glycosyltransferase family 4 protein [Nitrospiraceae bacterium]